MPHIEIDVRDDTPIEWDCPSCQTHHVIEPRKLRRIVTRPLFRCAWCRRYRRRAKLHGVGIQRHGVLASCCVDCDGERGEHD